MAISSLALTICSNRFVPSKFLFSVRCRYIVDAMISCMSSCRTLCACSHLVKLVCEIVFAWKNARKRWRAFFSLLPILTWVCIAARALTLSIFQRHEPRICVFANISPVSPCYCHFNLFIHRISSSNKFYGNGVYRVLEQPLYGIDHKNRMMSNYFVSSWIDLIRLNIDRFVIRLAYLRPIFSLHCVRGVLGVVHVFIRVMFVYVHWLDSES